MSREKNPRKDGFEILNISSDSEEIENFQLPALKLRAPTKNGFKKKKQSKKLMEESQRSCSNFTIVLTFLYLILIATSIITIVYANKIKSDLEIFKHETNKRFNTISSPTPTSDLTILPEITDTNNFKNKNYEKAIGDLTASTELLKQQIGSLKSNLSLATNTNSALNMKIETLEKKISLKFLEFDNTIIHMNEISQKHETNPIQNIPEMTPEVIGNILSQFLKTYREIIAQFTDPKFQLEFEQIVNNIESLNMTKIFTKLKPKFEEIMINIASLNMTKIVTKLEPQLMEIYKLDFFKKIQNITLSSYVEKFVTKDEYELTKDSLRNLTEIQSLNFSRLKLDIDQLNQTINSLNLTNSSIIPIKFIDIKNKTRILVTGNDTG